VGRKGVPEEDYFGVSHDLVVPTEGIQRREKDREKRRREREKSAEG
jgi:hypothetical protein